MAKRKKGDFFFEKAADIFDLPGEIVAGMSRITVTGGSRVFIENHKGILEYGRERIEINGGRVIITVGGEGLDIRNMSDSELLITGRILSLHFDY